MVGLGMDPEVLKDKFYYPGAGAEQASSIEIGSQELSGDGKKNRKKMDDQARMENKLAQTMAFKVKDDINVVDLDRTLEEEGLRNSERSDEEEIVDVSPSGCTLASLEFAKQELAAKVDTMFVFDNTFTVLPASIQKYKNLRKLKFFSNEIRTLPEELGDLTQLEQLYLKLSPAGLGSLPALGNLRSLKALELHQVPARPSASSLSREIAQLHSLTRLSVCHFSISWVPVELGSLENLEELDLSFNKLKSLPKELAGLLALKSLRVASNKLVELPSELTNLPRLVSLDVSHNRLTSLSPLRLVSMTSLKVLNAQFNKLQHVGDIPDWISCKLEGNERLRLGQNQSEEQTENCTEEYLLDWEPPESPEFPNSTSNLSAPTSVGKGSSPILKGHSTVRGKRGWKKQDNQQQKARQDRLNSSRKHRFGDHGEATGEHPVPKGNSDTASAIEIHRKDAFPEEILHGQSETKSVSLHAGKKQTDSQQSYPAAKLKAGDCVKSGQHAQRNEDAVKSSEELQADEEVHQDDSLETVEDSCRDCQHEHSSVVNLKGFQSEVHAVSMDEKNCCRKAISGDRCQQDVQEVSLEECEEDDRKDTKSESLNSCVSVAGVKAGRRQDSDGDKNPKPSKRRRSLQEFSKVSFKYCIESFVGFEDRLHDGFYDAGRDRPFLPLDVLEKEQPCLDSREVILVDREKDEDLDVMALSAQTLLAGVGSPIDGDGKAMMQQRMTLLALFVSDCFGGSDKTHSISNMRRAALGGTAGMPFVCSCSSNNAGMPLNKLTEKSASGVVLPSVHMLCEGAVRFLKEQKQSNVLPIGSFSYGVCRHRAILFKYLCDRADPVIPCELVRGYLDYMPHAWNVVKVENANGSSRRLVDACRPLDIREERDLEYFCRYIPLKRIHLPADGGQKTVDSDIPAPVFHEDIGNGASGAVVRRCSFGTFAAAAKVRQLEAMTDGPGGFGSSLENSCLSELRMLCSLQEHPCIVSFYGHHLSSGFTSSSDSAELVPQPPQLTIFMEYVRGGSLEGFLQGLAQKGQAHTPPKLALHVARKIACALSMLHSKSIIHRDIKSSNVLIDMEAKQESDCSAPVVKLCDFDSAVPLQSSSAHTCYLAHRGVPSADVCVGTPRWIAPEVLRAMYGRHSYGLEADLWSFGCLLVELLTLKVPYDGLTETEVHSRIQIGQRPQLPSTLEKLRSPSSGVNDSATHSASDTEILSILVKLFYSCTEPSPSKRPTAKEVFSALASDGRACTTSSRDGQIQEEAPALEAPNGQCTPKVDDETSPSAEDSCKLCNTAKTRCSCKVDNNPDESSVDPADTNSGLGSSEWSVQAQG